MKTRQSLAIGALLCTSFAFPSESSADETMEMVFSPSSKAEAMAEERNQRLDTAVDASAESNGDNHRDIVAFLYSEDDKRVNLKLSFLDSSVNSAHFGASFNLDDNKVARLSPDFDNLKNNDLKLELGFSWAFWPSLAFSEDSVSRTRQTLRDICHSWNTDPKNADTQINLVTGCTLDKVSSDPELSNRFLRTLLADKPYRYLNLTAEMSYQNYKFNELGTLAESRRSELEEALRITFGWVSAPTRGRNSPSHYTVSYRRENSFKEVGPTQVCSPLQNPKNAFSCQNVRLGAPTETKVDSIGVEFRKSFQNRFAVGPRLFRELDNDVTGLELPVWISRSTSGPLNLGLKLGWRSDTKDAIYSLFAGTDFKL